MQRVCERGIKQINMIDMASIAGKQTNKKKANKQGNKQKMVSARDKCRFGLIVHNFIVLKHG